MKNLFSVFPKHDKFQPVPTKAYLRKFRIYPPFLYYRLDKWLTEMSLSGWHVVDSNIISFLFEKGEPADKQYFTYDSDIPRNDTGKYSIRMRYPFLDKTYGVKKSHSKLNKNEKKAYMTIEIDIKKIDIENDTGFKELLSDRNSLYKRRAAKNVLILTVLIILVSVLFALYRG